MLPALSVALGLASVASSTPEREDLRYARAAPHGHPRTRLRERPRRAPLLAAPRRPRRGGDQGRAPGSRGRHSRVGHDRPRGVERLRLDEPRQAERRARPQGGGFASQPRGADPGERRLPAELHAGLGGASRGRRAGGPRASARHRLHGDLGLRSRRAVRGAERLRPRRPGRDRADLDHGHARGAGPRRRFDLRHRCRELRGGGDRRRTRAPRADGRG